MRNNGLIELFYKNIDLFTPLVFQSNAVDSEKEVRSAAFFQGGGPATSTSDPYQRGRQPYHSSHHAPVVRAFWQWRNADQIAVWSHCLHVSQPPSMIMSESCWAPEPGSGLSGPGWFCGWHFPSMSGLVELQSQPRLMCLSWAPQHSAGSRSGGGGTGAASPC